jgi:DNA-binding CsgD family transcriptional regulator
MGDEGGSRPANAGKTDRAIMLRLCALAMVFVLLNSFLQMRLFPLASGLVDAHEPFFPVVIPAVLLLAFLSDRSVLVTRLPVGRPTPGPFLRALLIPMMLLFILMPALHFLSGHPLLALAMNSLILITRFSIWVIFTGALVELYRGRRLFYACAASMMMVNLFSSVGFLFIPVIPDTPGYRVAVSVLAALLFVVIGFRTLFPGNPLLAGTGEAPARSVDTLFHEHGLTAREIEVARMIVMERLSNQEIADRISRSKITVEKRISSIYQKFAVKDRPAFVAKVLKP